MRKVSPDESDLVALQRAGLLIWRDPEPLPPFFFGNDYHRLVTLNKHREDFTEETLRLWAQRGELFEKQK
ncbi:hypothetical protein [Citrobacter portucalensis]|uniref:hypothetical protein n=1 Tax=Citrobacter portucalensis TaxID=1639133 RepID=UPI00226B4A4C|nr:hypothetical protein [Citrobacter portucalensis]MCX8985123.1 hypothetical protein [Citrobacter portucalensis]